MSDIRLHVAHEALLTHWKRAKTQIKEDKGLLEVRRRVETDMRLWEQSGKPTELLLPAGLKLIEAEKLSEEWKKELDVGIRDYIQASLNAEQERQRKERETQDELKRRLVEAEHNFGLTLLEKASQYLAQCRHNEVYVYVAHARKLLKPDTAWEKIQEKHLVDHHPIPPKRLYSHLGHHIHPYNHVVTFSLDGSVLASGSFRANVGNTVCLWDVATGQLRQELTYERILKNLDDQPYKKSVGLQADITSIAFSPSGQFLAAASEEGELYLWNLKSCDVMLLPVYSNKRIKSIAFSSDGQTLAIALCAKLSNDKKHQILLCGVPEGEVRHILVGHEKSVTSVAFHPKSQLLASGSVDKTIRLWDITSGQQQQVLTGHEEGVSCVAFSPDGQLLASGAGDYTIRLWDVTNGQESQILTDPENRAITSLVTSLSFSPDGQLLASTGGALDKSIRLWDVATGQLHKVLISREHVGSVAFSPDGQVLASDGIIRLWDMSGDQLYKIIIGSDYWKGVGFSPDGRVLLCSYGHSVNTTNKIVVWDVISRQLRHVLPNKDTLIDIGLGKMSYSKTSITCATVSPDSQMLALGLEEKDKVSLFDIVSGQLRYVLTGHKARVNDITFSPDGRILAFSSSDNTIRLWNPVNGQQKKLINNEAEVGHIVFSPDGQLLATESKDKTIRLWDVNTGLQRQVLNIYHECNDEFVINEIIFSPNGQLLASSTSDMKVYLWDVDNGQQLKVLTGHNSCAFDNDNQLLTSHDPQDRNKYVAFSHDGQLLVSADGDDFSNDKTIQLREVATNKLLQTLTGREPISKVVFSPDDQLLASIPSAFNRKLIHLWWTHQDLPYDLNSYDTSLSATEVEQWLHLTLDGLEVKPSFSREVDNAYYEIPPAIQWSSHNPLYWLPKVQSGDAEAMLQLAIRYYYCGVHQHNNARHWLEQAQAAGNPKAAYYLNLLNN